MPYIDVNKRLTLSPWMKEVTENGKPTKKVALYLKQDSQDNVPWFWTKETPGDMPEMVIDKKAFAQISPETKSALLREISTVKGFENGYYQKGTFYTGTSQTNSNSNSGEEVVELLKMALTVVAQNTEVMNDIKENGLAAFVSNRDMPSMKNLKKGIKEYDELISKSKVS